MFKEVCLWDLRRKFPEMLSYINRDIFLLINMNIDLMDNSGIISIDVKNNYKGD